jgi:pyruvate,water dikinase
MEKKRVDISKISENEKYVKWLSELNKDSGSIAGGKGANLAEMYNAKFPVPPAFCITAQSFDTFLKKSGIKEKIKEIIEKTNVDNTQELDDNSSRIRKLIVDSEMPEDMAQEILESYELLSSESSEDIGIANKTKNNHVFVAVRSSATTEDLEGASFAGQQETFTNIKGEKELINAVKKCFASLYTARAVYYRHKKGFDKANALLSVVVQKMIGSDKSGVMFTKNPMNGNDEIIIEAVFGLGEGIVSGKILPDHYVLDNELELKDKKNRKQKNCSY